MNIRCPKYIISTLVTLSLASSQLTAQLGFCGGNSGDPIFNETFGVGTTNGPALPAGTTTYNFTTGAPNDGDYTISSTTNYFDWHSIPDHTPGDTNGKAFIVNASFTAGEFYQRQVSGLCENTSYEFSSWLVNLLPNSVCESNGIPINVRFQIWDETDTTLLAQGDTGNIPNRASPVWEQYALVFKTEPGQTSVILKMRNNSNGGCGNDLAIDDIIFKSCGDNVTVSTDANESGVTVCADQGAISRNLTATPDFTIFKTHAYQWQQSTDQQIWTDIPSETNASITTPSVTETTYFRVKIAEDPINVSNELCNVVSDVFELLVLPIPTAPTSNGDITICEGAIGILEVVPQNGFTVNWYDAPIDGNLLFGNNARFETATAGTYYAEANSPVVECASISRTAVTLTTDPLPIVQDETLRFCENTTLRLSADLDNVSYAWNTGATTKEIEVGEAGTYTVTVTDLNGCNALKTIILEQIVIPQIATIVSDGPSIRISTSNSGNFEYSLDGIHFQDRPFFAAMAGGFYIVYVKNRTDCEAITQTFFHLVIPKFFTPNGDTINDIFELQGLEVFNKVSFSIFDRYGALLKYGNSNNTFWDGTFQGKEMPSADYWYYIKADTAQFKGHFTLKR